MADVKQKQALETWRAAAKRLLSKSHKERSEIVMRAARTHADVLAAG